jgi:site-specific DNA-cytosine methylase
LTIAGQAQNRERVFIVGVQRAFSRGSFMWPEPTEDSNILNFLDKRTRDDNHSNLPPETAVGARNRLKRAVNEIVHNGINPETSDAIVNIDSSKGHYMNGVSPCITKARGLSGGHWVLRYGRRFSATEIERLFGFHLQPASGGFPVSAARPASVSERAWTGMLGNSIPVPLVAAVLSEALPECRLTPRLHNVWQKSRAW